MNITQEERNALKSKIQESIVSLSKIHAFMILEIGTGVGKGKMVIECINEDKSGQKWLICVPEIAQIENFKNELKKFNYEYLLDTKIEAIICYASLKNYANTSLSIALNEVQSLSDERFEIIQTIKYKRIIADSATISEEIQYKLTQLADFYTYSLPLKEAIKLGVLPQPKIYLIPVDINTIKETFEYTKFKKLYKNVSANDYCNYLTSQMDYWRKRFNQTHEKYMENQSLQYASKRKRFLGNLKTIKAKELIKKFEEEKRRFIVFSTDIKQSEEIGSKEHTIHSKKSAKTNANIIKKFNSMEYDRLFSVGMVISGMTLSDLDTGMIIQLDSGSNNDSLKAVQILGRVLRSDTPSIYILYLPNTQDEKYLKNMLNIIGNDFIVK